MFALSELLRLNLRYNEVSETTMLNKTITKNPAFVILLLIFSLISNACFSVSSQDDKNTAGKSIENSSVYVAPKIVGTIENKKITESSGIAASPCQADVLWTHNDSGDSARIFAIGTKGEDLAEFRVKGAENYDWEDIAAYKNKSGECFLYIGDIGNNARVRGEFQIYRIKEPSVSGKNSASTETAETIKFAYPDFRHDAETLMVNPKNDDIYILSKRLSGASGVYKLKSDFSLSKTNILEKITDFTVPAVPNGFLTGGDISPDGKRVIICDYFQAYELILPEHAKNFDDIWKQKPLKVELGKRKQGEAVGYSADGNSIFATSEKKDSPLIEIKRK